VDDHAEPFKELRRLVNMSVSRIHSREARTLAAAGRFDGAVAAQREAIAIVPGEDQLIYGLARLHARAGDAEGAVAALEQAIRIDARWRELAASQTDFDNIRENAEFQTLLNIR
ncbi:MAG: tetratricopeptide repeat protein, partial [Acidobacteriota bacterium]|nr:tetratricopeptide repeat protein [Acidobacteriota bacterium]